MTSQGIRASTPFTRPRSERPTDAIGPRTGITAPSDRRLKDEHRERLARDLEQFLARGGQIDELPLPREDRTRRVGHGGVMGL